jgi:hypothetical protein
MPWESRRAWVGSCAAAARPRTPAFVSGASGNITWASCACSNIHRTTYEPRCSTDDSKALAASPACLPQALVPLIG